MKACQKEYIIIASSEKLETSVELSLDVGEDNCFVSVKIKMETTSMERLQEQRVIDG